MPYVKWRKGPDEDITPEDNMPVGKSVLQLTDVRVSANYTCIASSTLGMIEATTMVKVQCEFNSASAHRRHVCNVWLELLFNISYVMEEKARPDQVLVCKLDHIPHCS